MYLLDFSCQNANASQSSGFFFPKFDLKKYRNIKSSMSDCHYYDLIDSFLNASRLKKSLLTRLFFMCENK